MNQPERPWERAAAIAASTRRHAQELRDAAARTKAAINETRALVTEIEAKTPALTRCRED